MSRPIIANHDSVMVAASIRSYVRGFVLSLCFTLGAYFLAVHHTLSVYTLGIVLGLLAVIQFIVQLFSFLHIGHELGPRYRLLVLGFMTLVVVIIIAGSLWIMTNLNQRMTPMQVQQYLNNQDNL